MSHIFRLTTKPLPPVEIASKLESGLRDVDEYLGQQIYANSDPEYLARQRKRFSETARHHEQPVGEKPSLLIRAPGRITALFPLL